jgi:hypothetical protein
VLEFTAEDLVQAAREAGFDASTRLITDWVGLGLLDRPRRRSLGQGNGSLKAVWPPAQKDCFLSLLHHRQTVKQVAPLANLPVWVWLAYGNEWIPLRQARTALGTWCGRHRSRPGVSATEARRMSRRFVETVAYAHTQQRDRAGLRRVVEDSLQTMTFDRQQFHAAVLRVFDPHNEGRTIGPSGAPMNTDVLVRAVEARFTALHQLDQFTDQQFEDARFVFLTTKESYAKEQEAFAQDPLTGQMHPGLSLDREVNRACYDLLTLLGMNVLAPKGFQAIVAEAATS